MFHLLSRVFLRIFLVAATALNLLLFLQLRLPEAAGEKHDLSQTFLSKNFPISPSSTSLWALFGHPETRVLAPNPLGQASQVASTSTSPNQLLHPLLLPPISGRATPLLSLLPHSCHLAAPPMRAPASQPSNGSCWCPLFHASC